MAAVIIRKKDVDRLAQKVLKEVFDFLHDEYILTNFEEMKSVQEKFLRNIVLHNFRYLNMKTISKRGRLQIQYEPFDENKFEDKLNKVKDEIKNGTICNYVIYHTLNDIDIDEEVNGDLYFKKNAFLNIYDVFESDYTYLED